MRTRAVLGVVPLLLFSTACQDTTGFRSYECGKPAPAAVTNGASPETAYTIDGTEWDETAVRQVLHVFAFGGFASDAQITAWADAAPSDAIREIMTFDTVNEKLSPPGGDTNNVGRDNGTLGCMAGLLSVDSTDNPVPSRDRSGFRVDEYDAVPRIWAAAARTRGLNTFRQRIGLWETNYHLAVSSNAGLTNRQIAAFYDGIMNDHARNLPYGEVLTHAALSPAVAQQYNHRQNVYVDGRFRGNEDFGREYHQLYFGILGNYDDAYVGDMAELHELVTIPDTARALTDMRVPQDGRGDTIDYGRSEHWQGPLQILETSVPGNTAQERFEFLADKTINHPESVQTLPIDMIRQLADDQLDPSSTDPDVMARVAAVRAIWAGLSEKNLLTFLRAYAISSAFHDPSRVKFWNSIERNFLANNLTTVSNQEAFRDVYDVRTWIGNEDVSIFRPAHDVFGGQTGLEASTTADVFRNAYNRSVAAYWSLTRVEENGWRKEWSPVVPRGEGGEFRVITTAEWLWQRYVADGLANFGPLERAHLYALLASGTDLGYWIDSASPTSVYTLAQISGSGAVHNQIVGAEQAIIRLASEDEDERRNANYRVSLAVNFIVATPYFMAQQGR